MSVDRNTSFRLLLRKRLASLMPSVTKDAEGLRISRRRHRCFFEHARLFSSFCRRDAIRENLVCFTWPIREGTDE
jgi:hypothetical protein